MLQMAPDYDHLTLMEKVEVFEHAVNNTAGDDLAKLLWLKSPSSEVRSTIFFRTWEDDLVFLCLTYNSGVQGSVIEMFSQLCFKVNTVAVNSNCCGMCVLLSVT